MVKPRKEIIRFSLTTFLSVAILNVQISKGFDEEGQKNIVSQRVRIRCERINVFSKNPITSEPKSRKRLCRQ